MRRLDHQNIVQLKYFFFSSGDKVSRTNETQRRKIRLAVQLKEEVYLNLVLEFIPETVYRVARHYTKQKQTIPLLYVKVRSIVSEKEKENSLLTERFLRSFSCTCINCFVHWPTFIHLAFAIETSNLKIFYSILKHQF